MRPCHLGLFAGDNCGANRGTTCERSNLCHSSTDSKPSTLSLTINSKTDKIQRRSKRLIIVEVGTNPSQAESKREFSLYCEKSDLSWTSDPIFSQLRKQKFAREQDDSDEEILKKESKKCMQDLKEAVAKFVKYPPETLVVNL